MKTKLFKYKGTNVSMTSLTDNDNMLVNYHQKGQFYEQRLLEKIKSLNVGGTYIDLGANIGNHSTFFGLFCNSDKIISVEAEPSIYGILNKNMDDNIYPINKPFEVHNYAISDFEGLVSMTPIRDYNVGGTHVVEGSGDIKCNTLDNLFGDEKNVGLIKMDIEGHELRAITKGTNLITNNYPVIISELSDKGDFNEFKAEITKYGYTTDGVNYANTPTYIWIKK